MAQLKSESEDLQQVLFKISDVFLEIKKVEFPGGS